MGQLLMKMYPELSCVQSDVLGTGKFMISNIQIAETIIQWPPKNH